MSTLRPASILLGVLVDKGFFVASALALASLVGVTAPEFPWLALAVGLAATTLGAFVSARHARRRPLAHRSDPGRLVPSGGGAPSATVSGLRRSQLSADPLRGGFMPQALDLSSTFVHLSNAGDAEPVKATPSFWRDSATRGRYDRLVGSLEFNSSEDLHSSMQEMHPEADELIFLVSGAIDVVLEEAGAERGLPLEAGQAAIVPRGVWHRLVVRQPGKLLFINSRAGIQSRPA